MYIGSLQKNPDLHTEEIGSTIYIPFGHPSTFYNYQKYTPPPPQIPFPMTEFSCGRSGYFLGHVGYYYPGLKGFSYRFSFSRTFTAAKRRTKHTRETKPIRETSGTRVGYY